MIDMILKAIYGVESGMPEVQLDMEVKTAPFVLSDPCSCCVCPQQADTKGYDVCNQEILRVDNHGATIEVVRFEEFIQQFRKLQNTQRCDLIMADAGMERNKIVFCDLCCYEEKYVEPNTGYYPEGKRAKARQQMKQSIEILIRESTTAVNLLTYANKVCLFAWRNKNWSSTSSPQRGNVLANMSAFTRVPSTTVQQMQWEENITEQHGFTFWQVVYPSEYVW